jgi:hypothetical protein
MSISPELFRHAFSAAFKINRWLIKFDTNRQRTSHMVSHIYRTIADYLDLSIDYEYQSIDTVFYSREAAEANDATIEVAVEHENSPNTADAELRKLVSYNFPLSVLITYPWTGRADWAARITQVIHDAGWASLPMGEIRGDGAPGSWNVAEAHFPGVRQPRDYDHLSEPL